MHDEQEQVSGQVPETEASAAEFEALIHGRCREAFKQRVQQILEGRLRALRLENECFRRSEEQRRAFESGCVERLAREAEELRRLYGEFDWQREMRDPTFGRLIAAGVDGRTAYAATHSRQLLAQAVRYGARRAGEQLSRTVASGGSRIAENGGGSSAVTRTDPRKLTPEELAEIRRRVQRGEKIRF